MSENDEQKKRTPITSYGQKKRPGYVSVYAETRDEREYVRVEWKENGGQRKQSFDNSRIGKAAAKAFAEETHARLIGGGETKKVLAPITIREMWEAYLTAKGDTWRPATMVTNTGRWNTFELFAERHTPATAITRETLDRFKKALLAAKTRHARDRSPNQIKHTIGMAVRVFEWAVDRDLIPPTKVTSYIPEFAKDAQGVEMAEYLSGERGNLIAALDPRDSRQWRAWAFTVLLAHCGPRQNAARRLEWDDLELEPKGGTIKWRREKAKMGKPFDQPMPEPVAHAFWVAYGWALACGYSGRWVFFRAGAGLKDRSNGGYVTARTRRRAAAKPDQPMGYAAYNTALHKAEERAGITPIKYRAAHGMRRGVAGDIHAHTGSEKAAANWIGDKSVKIVGAHYLLRRDEELQKAAVMIALIVPDKSPVAKSPVIDRKIAQPSDNRSEPLQSSLK